MATFLSLDDTSNTPIPNGYLRWNSAGDNILYETSVSALNVTGLATVATSGDIGDLANVDVTGVVDNYILTYNATTSKWEAKVNDGGMLSSFSLSDISDVIISTPIAGKILYFDGTDWVDHRLNYATDIDGIPSNNTYSFIGLSDTNNASVGNGYLKWSSGGTAIEYVTSIPSSAITGLADVATSGDYVDLINPPTIYTQLNDLEDVDVLSLADQDVLLWNATSSKWTSQSWTTSSPTSFISLTDTVNTIVPDGYLRWNSVGSAIVYQTAIASSDITGLADVATSGDYTDLINKPDYTFATLGDTAGAGTADYFLRWDGLGLQVAYQQYIDATTDISNLADVATSGDYTDLINKPANTLLGLSDTSNSSPADGAYVMWSTGSGEFVYTTGITVDVLDVTSLQQVAIDGWLDSLNDVVIDSPFDKQILQYDGTDWVNTYLDNSRTWTVVSASFSATKNRSYIVDTSSAVVTITLPSSPVANDYIRIADYAGTFELHSCIIANNSDKILGEVKDYILATNNACVELTYVDSTYGWRITSGNGEKYNWQEISGDYTADPNEGLLLDTTVDGPITITLPPITITRLYDTVKIVDLVGNFNVNSCIVARNLSDASPAKIMGDTDNLVVTAKNISLELTYVGGTTGWVITDGLAEIEFENTDILVDTTLYVDISGDDVLGTGTILAPYATLAGALSAVDKRYIANDVFLTIDVGAANYGANVPTIISHPQGDRIKIEGAAPTVTANITSVNGTPTSTSFSINVSSVAGISTGQFVKIKNTSGTGYHTLIRGIYSIIDTGPTYITVDLNYQGEVSDLEGIVLTGGDIEIQKTILTYGGVSGIVLNGSKINSINNITIVGDNTVNTYGVLCGQDDNDMGSTSNTGGSISFGSNVNIYLFGGSAVYCSYNSFVSASYAYMTRNKNGLYASYNGVIRSAESIITNTPEVAAKASYGGVIDLKDEEIYGTGKQAFKAVNRGTIKSDSTGVTDRNDLTSSGQIVYASGMSAIFMADFSGSGVSYSPTYNSVGNGNSFIGAI